MKKNNKVFLKKNVDGFLQNLCLLTIFFSMVKSRSFIHKNNIILNHITRIMKYFSLDRSPMVTKVNDERLQDVYY